MTFNLGGIVIALFQTLRDIFNFLDSVTFDFIGLQFSLLHLCVAFIVLTLIFQLIFPWFGEEDN